ESAAALVDPRLHDQVGASLPQDLLSDPDVPRPLEGLDPRPGVVTPELPGTPEDRLLELVDGLRDALVDLLLARLRERRLLGLLHRVDCNAGCQGQRLRQASAGGSPAPVRRRSARRA